MDAALVASASAHEPSGTRSQSFMAWLRSLSPDDMTKLTQSFETFKFMESEYYRLHPQVKVALTKRNLGVQKALTTYHHRVSVGLDFLRWKASAKEDVRGKELVSYCRAKWKFEDEVPKRVRQWLSRCAAVASKESGVPVASASDKHRFRARGRQGRPIMCPEIREGLFDWFIAVRGAVAARITSRFLRLKALAMREDLLQEMRRVGKYSQLPQIDRKWMYRWRRDFSVCLRKPTTQYKCSLRVLLQRLRAMWVTNFRVRCLAQLAFGFDPLIYGFDQKGLHMNEAGSKNMSTLAIKGALEVPLKENHAATRSRFSLMTSVVSKATAASAPGLPPLEVLFKGCTNKIVRALELPKDMNVYPAEIK